MSLGSNKLVFPFEREKISVAFPILVKKKVVMHRTDRQPNIPFSDWLRTPLTDWATILTKLKVRERQICCMYLLCHRFISGIFRRHISILCNCIFHRNYINYIRQADKWIDCTVSTPTYEAFVKLLKKVTKKKSHTELQRLQGCTNCEASSQPAWSRIISSYSVC